MATLPFVKPWPGGRIPYSIEDPQRDEIQKAVDMVNERTIIKFVPRKGEPDYVRFIEGNENAALNSNWHPPYDTVDVIGYCPGDTRIILASKGKWLALHEIGHVLGLIHEHQRTDRNEYLEVPCRKVTWDILPESVNQGLAYNGSSVMHYGLGWQGCNAKWIKGKNPGQQWEDLTSCDALGIDIVHRGLLPRVTPAWYDVWYGVLGLEKPADEYDRQAGVAIRGACRFSTKMGYKAALPTFEARYAMNGITLFAPGVEWRDVNYHDLGLDRPTDEYLSEAGKAIRMTHRYANSQGFATGFPNFEASYEKCGVMLLSPDLVDIRDVNYHDLGLDNPTNYYDSEAGKAIRMTHRYANSQGYVTGFPNFEASNDNCGVILIKSL